MMKVFKDREELKWYFHAKLCKGNVNAEYLMNECVNEKHLKTVKDVNEWLKLHAPKCRVKEK